MADQWPTLNSEVGHLDGMSPPLERHPRTNKQWTVCDRCDYMQWGTLGLACRVPRRGRSSQVDVFLAGYWVAGDITQGSGSAVHRIGELRRVKPWATSPAISTARLADLHRYGAI